MTMSVEHRPSPAIVTSPYEWKIFKGDEKSQIKNNKQGRLCLQRIEGILDVYNGIHTLLY